VQWDIGFAIGAFVDGTLAGRRTAACSKKPLPRTNFVNYYARANEADATMPCSRTNTDTVLPVPVDTTPQILVDKWFSVEMVASRYKNLQASFVSVLLLAEFDSFAVPPLLFCGSTAANNAVPCASWDGGCEGGADGCRCKQPLRLVAAIITWKVFAGSCLK
jgi:hypothetical protein